MDTTILTMPNADDKHLEDKEPVKRRKRVPLHPGFPELARSDTSIFPSYTKFAMAYSVVCRHRYHFAKIAQRKQLTEELHSFEALQYNALDGVRVHREFSQGILSHKIPTRRYMNHLTPDPLKVNERMRLEDIIKGHIDHRGWEKLAEERMNWRTRVVTDRRFCDEAWLEALADKRQKRRQGGSVPASANFVCLDTESVVSQTLRLDSSTINAMANIQRVTERL